MKIPRTTVDVGQEELEAVKRVFERGQFVKGPECEALEKEFATYQGTKYGAAVNSGTSALHLSLLAIGIQSGDEIITVPNTFAATVNAIIMAGGRPKFVDINPHTYTMDATQLESAITPKTKAIIPVHLYGLMADMKPIREIADKHDLYVIEDACQAHGAKYFGKKAGYHGDLAAFSFFPTKNMTVAGDGGIVLSNNEELITKIKALRDHGRMMGKHVFAGLNNRLSEIFAAIGRINLKKLDEHNEHRRKIANIYSKHLSEIQDIEIPIEPKGYYHVYHLYTIKTSNRDELRTFLKNNNIETGIMYDTCLDELDYIKKLNDDDKSRLDNCKNIKSKILSLPISGKLEQPTIENVCKKIKTFHQHVSP